MAQKVSLPKEVAEGGYDWLALPQTPAVPELPDGFAEQFAVEPLPTQDQYHGPLPVTAVGVPALHKLVVGAVLNVWPLALPQTPLVTEGQAATVIPPLAFFAEGIKFELPTF